MTATEVGAREREKLLMFAPSFTQFVSDFSPLMVRLFGVLARGGFYPPPPPSVVRDLGDGFGDIDPPEVLFMSRIALAIKALQGEGFDRVMGRLMPFAEINPDILDNFDFDVVFRELSRNEGMNEEWLRAKDLVDDLRKQRAMVAQQREQREMASQGADALGKVGGVEGLEELQNLEGFSNG